MAVPAPHVLAAGAGGLLLLLFAVGAFLVVALVAAVILALIQAVLPGGDTEADRLHAAEVQAAERAAEAEAQPEAQQKAQEEHAEAG
jgi:hypothetical protein